MKNEKMSCMRQNQFLATIFRGKRYNFFSLAGSDNLTIWLYSEKKTQFYNLGCVLFTGPKNGASFFFIFFIFLAFFFIFFFWQKNNWIKKYHIYKNNKKQELFKKIGQFSQFFFPNPIVWRRRSNLTPISNFYFNLKLENKKNKLSCQLDWKILLIIFVFGVGVAAPKQFQKMSKR